jgi:hypothetical protein
MVVVGIDTGNTIDYIEVTKEASVSENLMVAEGLYLDIVDKYRKLVAAVTLAVFELPTEQMETSLMAALVDVGELCPECNQYTFGKRCTACDKAGA